MAVESTIWLFCLLSLFCGPSKQGKAPTLIICMFFVFVFVVFLLSLEYMCEAAVHSYYTKVQLLRS